MTEILLALLLTTILLVALTLLLHSMREILLPSRPVTVTVNRERKVRGATNYKLLDILNAGGVPVPSGCAGAGTCGLCRVGSVAGAGDALPTEKARLTPAELREGTRLACQVVVRGDLAVEVSAEILGIIAMRATVASTCSVTPLIKEIVFQLPPDAAFAFRAGNFVQVTAPVYRLPFTQIDIDPAFTAEWDRLKLRALVAEAREPVSRAYSVASRPADRGTVVLNIRLAVPPPAAKSAAPGVVSSFLFGLKVGDTAAIAGPYGHFHAQDTDREMVFIGGGVGMAPLRAIIFDQLERVGTTHPITFFYGARSASELFYMAEFEELAVRHPNFRFVPALSEPARGSDWRGETGFVHDIAFRSYLRDHPAPEACEYYLCGPPLMIEAVYAMLDECGVEPASIFNDDFGI
ncbi:NADH:ubiquinone reductase (Na(+)-transporting) subunit F [Aureimonas altamirensis]|uniref:NADH:ubiquinone reductase (Na(+)-transporting) subunit F n=1 Tax=Aureimonas altamirensis TaxID=370622 RepID=UPI001E40813D|nr:NADH:ubiquinone reductase (Na(+)-transporting) subunit F [Aureimonas altamirensis]UHD46469.1 NADH:ubiquinone reductase (Na(+)-transporting) subunit F [Aureimonas altamirensis]